MYRVMEARLTVFYFFFCENYTQIKQEANTSSEISYYFASGLSSNQVQIDRNS